jgi:hypothetical protein
MGGVHGASRDIDHPSPVSLLRQISSDSVEPMVASRSRNLLSHKDRRSEPRGAAFMDESIHVGPQMPWVISTASLPGLGERLARTARGPDRTVVGPSGLSCGDGPEPASGKEMHLGKASDVIGADLLDGFFRHDARRDHAFADQPAQKVGGERVDLVVEGAVNHSHHPLTIGGKAQRNSNV